jgi:hypothetical protein
MRQRHQAINISTYAKKNFCNEISLNNYTYEEELKEHLREYFSQNLREEDIEDKNDISSDDDSFEISEIKVPKQSNNNDFAKFQISEKAIISRIQDFNYEIIPKKAINIGQNDDEKIPENNRNIGATIKLEDIIKQYFYWKDKEKDKTKVNNEIDSFQLFNLNLDKIKDIKKKITDIKKIAKDKKMDETNLNKLLKELENDYNEQKKELNNLVNKIDKIDNITYGKNWSIVEYQK